MNCLSHRASLRRLHQSAGVSGLLLGSLIMHPLQSIFASLRCSPHEFTRCRFLFERHLLDALAEAYLCPEESRDSPSKSPSRQVVASVCVRRSADRLSRLGGATALSSSFSVSSELSPSRFPFNSVLVEQPAKIVAFGKLLNKLGAISHHLFGFVSLEKTNRQFDD
jgi:hypothetical protein